MTLTEFIEARLAEKAAAHRELHEARVCSGCSDGWEAGFDPDRCDCGYPARVLREVEAGRKILAMHTEAQGWSYPPGDGDEAVQETLTDAALALAAIWDDHPDYAEAVRP